MKEKRLIPDDIDVAVIGAGVVGLAIARELAMLGRKVTVFEAGEKIGEHTSTRNSGVIHSGIYYPSGSLKARFCVAGKDKLYQYCKEKNIRHKKIGKLVVAIHDKEVPTLKKIQERAIANGVIDITWLTAKDISDMEPMVKGVAGLYSPSTGVADIGHLLQMLRHDAEEHGATIVMSTPVLSGEVQKDGIALALGGKNPSVVKCKTVINSAGLRATVVAQKIIGMPRDAIPEAYYTKGHYFLLNKPSPFTHLIYPIPEEGGLGIHVTLGMDGTVRFGPNVSPVDRYDDYSFDTTLEKKFYQAIRTYYPDLSDGDLRVGVTGIRPKLRSSSEQDFVIQGPQEHGVPGLINLFGIESPGLTASLAIAQYVGDRV